MGKPIGFPTGEFCGLLIATVGTVSFQWGIGLVIRRLLEPEGMG